MAALIILGIILLILLIVIVSNIMTVPIFIDKFNPRKVFYRTFRGYLYLMVLLTIQHRVGDNIIRISIVFGNKFFHPYHIVPLIKFVCTFMKNTDSFITEFFVKANTVVMQMFILMFSVRNTSIYICHTLLC